LTGNQSRLTIDGANNTNVNATVGTGTIVFSASTTVSVTKDGGSPILENQAHFRLDGYDFFDGSNAISQNVVAGSSADEGDFVTIATLTAEQASGTIGLRITFQRPSGEGDGTSNTSVRMDRIVSQISPMHRQEILLRFQKLNRPTH
jgi:hypothetical protein